MTGGALSFPAALGDAAGLLAVFFVWCVVALLLFGVTLVFFEELDFSEKSPLARASEYTLIAAVITGSGALVLGGIAWAWVLVEGLAERLGA